MFWNRFLLVIVPLVFFFIKLLTLSDYGISWDESFHFQRGQAYLHYFLTGEKDFLALPAYPKLMGDSDFMGRTGEQDIYLVAEKSIDIPEVKTRRSYYQSDVFTFSFLTSGFDGGHPPISDILSAFFNYIFYQKLGIVGDIEAYHLFEISISSLLILAVGIFVRQNFGLLPALTASLSLALYPLFFAESSFNIKDPPETAFFGISIISFYFGIARKNWLLLLLSALVTGFALGTKFNALFLPLIILPWFFYKFVQREFILGKGTNLALLSFPLIVVGIFFVFWPLLWQNSVENFIKILTYYRNIGVGITPGMESYIINGFNTYPLFWVFNTTPIPILVLSLLGFVYSCLPFFRKKSDASFLVMLWVLVPIIRVSLPNTNVYGGVRQVMEFIPPFAILSGMGLHFLMRYFYFPKEWLILVLFLSFSFVGWELARIHPNENVYFNQLIGGLPGAVQKNVPSWGNSYGNVYMQGVAWLNENAEQNSKLGLPITNMVNVPRIKLRPDIYFSNEYISGFNRSGEYVMEMAHDWPPKKWFGFLYHDTFLEPVHEVKVDGVSLLKIWRNDLTHTRAGFNGEKKYTVDSFNVKDSTISSKLDEEVALTRLEIKHENEDCDKRQVGGYIRLSTDGVNWAQEPETIDYPQIPLKWLGRDENNFVLLFPARRAKFIFLDTQNPKSCILKVSEINYRGF